MSASASRAQPVRQTERAASALVPALAVALLASWPAPAAASCGNGVAELNEGCDDGNTLPNDGCSAACGIESGYVCLIPGRPCAARLCEVAASGGAVFLRGNYVEIGLNPNAAFGSGAAPPPGWHARSGRTPNELGLVSDPEDTGWAGYHGDFFLSGAPEEGWSLEVNGFVGSNNRNGPTQITGSFGAPQCVAAGACGELGGARVTWEAAPFHGVALRKRYTLVDGGVFALVEVTLSNTTDAELTDVYYLRDIDPDNDEQRHGDFATSNLILSEPDQSGTLAHVRASQDVSGVQSAFALLADDARARVTRGGFRNRVPHDVWTGTDTLLQSGSAFADQAVSIAFKLDLPARTSRVFRYAYGLSQDASGALECLLDEDGDGAIDREDSAPADPTLCGDVDLDSCEDCASEQFAPDSDGPDADADGRCDAGDLDDDGDGVPDADDVAPSDPFACADSDLDGCDDCQLAGVAAPNGDGDDRDEDGACNGGDADTDGDGLPDSIEGTGDRDGDGVPNLLDLDADGDGLSDVAEQGFEALDADADGRLDDRTDSDHDGLPDMVDGAPLDAAYASLSESVRDTDQDGVPDALDFDSDDDGVADVDEGNDADVDGHGDLHALGSDGDQDGIDDAFDVDSAGHGALVPDSDGDGLPNYRDRDDDSDGLLSSREDPAESGDPALADTDGDGVPNFLDADDDDDGLLTVHEGADPNGDGDPSDALRTLDPRVPDYLNRELAVSHSTDEPGAGDEPSAEDVLGENPGLNDDSAASPWNGIAFGGGGGGCSTGPRPNAGSGLLLLALLAASSARRRERRYP